MSRVSARGVGVIVAAIIAVTSCGSSSGVQRSATLDPNLAKHPAAGLQLTADEKRDLIAFLKTLTDEPFTKKPATQSDHASAPLTQNQQP